jgi:hypothetical protein
LRGKSCPVIRHRIFQAQPALPRLAHAGFEFHVQLVVIETEPHLAREVSAGLNGATREALLLGRPRKPPLDLRLCPTTRSHLDGRVFVLNAAAQ